jgi:DNA-binding NtrC family response regulator
MPSSTRGIVRSDCAETRGRVLIVDDEPLVRWALATGLRAARFDALTATCGADAIVLAQGRPAPDAVLIDLELYQTDCVVLVEHIRAAAPACRVLLMTTSGPETGPRAASFWAGIPLIRKPFDLADVVRLIEQEIASAGAASREPGVDTSRSATARHRHPG